MRPEHGRDMENHGHIMGNYMWSSAGVTREIVSDDGTNRTSRAWISKASGGHSLRVPKFTQVKVDGIQIYGGVVSQWRGKVKE